MATMTKRLLLLATLGLAPLPSRAASEEVFAGLRGMDLSPAALRERASQAPAPEVQGAAVAPSVDFKGILAKTAELYGPKLAAEGLTLRTEERHTNTIVAWGDRDDKNAVLGVDSGYYSNPKVSEDGFRFVLCHELGHITGSAPRRPPPAEYDRPVHADGDMLISAEGQSDYYSAAKCMRHVLEKEDNVAYNRAHGVDPAAKAACDKQWPDPRASALCQRIAMAGVNFLGSMAIPMITSFGTPAQEKPEKTLVGEYPTRQCRLDTILAGALCTVDKDAPTSLTDPAAGYCTSKSSPAGARPRCWYKE